jgi:glycine cleavage system transcriptional repressor
MPSYALAAIGRDRPGIVAALAEVLFELGCNVEDSSMALLRGNFAVMVTFSAPDATTSEVIGEALEPACASLELTCSVLPIEDRPGMPEPTHRLTVYGSDRPGILYRVCEALAAASVNITDLESRLVGTDEEVYAMMLELAMPSGAEVSSIEERLRAIATEVGVDLTLRAIDDDIL